MSAYIVGREHVDALVATAIFGPEGTGTTLPAPVAHYWYCVNDPDTGDRLNEQDADRIGVELWTENLRSIHHRYPDTLEGGEYPGPLDFTPSQAHEYVFPVTTRPLTAVEAIKAAHCLDYQSCEHDGWEASWSCRFLNALVGALTTHVPGYDEAAWEVSR